MIKTNKKSNGKPKRNKTKYSMKFDGFQWTKYFCFWNV